MTGHCDSQIFSETVRKLRNEHKDLLPPGYVIKTGKKLADNGAAEIDRWHREHGMGAGVGH